MNLDFRELFREHAPFAWRSLMSFGLSSHAAEDACQEAFLVVHQKLAAGFVPEQPKAWIYGICWRVAAQHRRRRHVKRELAIEAPEVAADSARDPARLLEDRKRLARLDHALEQLPDEQRAVFVLYEIEQLAMREVAEALACSINTAFSRLYSARRKVAAELGLEVSEEVWKQ
jgi:RNA polymerase sigma-70 factor (ECF subfamily)